MNNVVAVLFIGFLLLTLIFVGIGGSFDRQFWLSVLPGLMENLAILAVAILIIENIFRKERLDKLEQTNAAQSRFVWFLSNRLAYLLLEHLDLATKDEVGNAELNFEFARERIKGIDLATVFYEKLMKAENRQAFVNGFEDILSRQTEAISKALDGIYPRPDPGIKQITMQTNGLIGSLGALKTLLEGFKSVNAQLGEDQQLKPEHLDVLIKVSYLPIRSELQITQSTIIQLSERAEANNLFICLD